jgi:hypothetical protein
MWRRIYIQESIVIQLPKKTSVLHTTERCITVFTKAATGSYLTQLTLSHTLILPVSLAVYLSICLFVRSFVRPSVRLSIHPPLSISLSICLSIYLTYLSVSLSTYISIQLSTYAFIRLYICPSVRPSVHPSIHQVFNFYTYYYCIKCVVAYYFHPVLIKKVLLRVLTFLVLLI